MFTMTWQYLHRFCMHLWIQTMVNCALKISPIYWHRKKMVVCVCGCMLERRFMWLTQNIATWMHGTCKQKRMHRNSAVRRPRIEMEYCRIIRNRRNKNDHATADQAANSVKQKYVTRAEHTRRRIPFSQIIIINTINNRHENSHNDCYYFGMPNAQRCLL